ncbi:MAG: NifU family protein [Sulfurovum sp.]|uniref:NifU family protein n=1 Tax=Sulfurovum sp. TaxID=1969726 RepID=UPI00286812EA|nr:NifU family protein [Sulfurovum sp.]MCO4844442.1 NifU family protein [Sulfurovum sp.]
MENTELEVKFEDMSLVQKINAIDAIIDDKIREFLQADNGDLDFIDVKETNGMTDVYISYVGACGSCESSGGTLVSIQKILNGQLETHNIRVYAI